MKAFYEKISKENLTKLQDNLREQAKIESMGEKVG